MSECLHPVQEFACETWHICLVRTPCRARQKMWLTHRKLERKASTLHFVQCIRSISILCPQKVLTKDYLFVFISNILCSEFHWACNKAECWQLFTSPFLRFRFLVRTAGLLEVAGDDGVFYCKSGRTRNKQNPSWWETLTFSCIWSASCPQVLPCADYCKQKSSITLKWIQLNWHFGASLRCRPGGHVEYTKIEQ